MVLEEAVAAAAAEASEEAVVAEAVSAVDVEAVVSVSWLLDHHTCHLDKLTWSSRSP